MKICYFGIFKDDFSRTKVIKKALESQGIEIIVCTDRTPSIKKYFNLIKKHNKIKNDYDFMLVGFPGYFIVFLGRILTSKPILFDAYISYFDGVSDRFNYHSLHPKLLYARMIDFLSVSCARITLVINQETKRLFTEDLKVPAEKIEVLHKGADETEFYPRKKDNDSTKKKYVITWWGTFIPLHGLHYIIDAAILLNNNPNIEFHIIGTGQLYSEIKNKIQSLRLTNTTLYGRVSDAQLIEEISFADMTLGLFNSSPKALRCVTNKVYEAMAMGKAIITEDSPANREIFKHNENAYLVLPANPQAIVHGIEELIMNQDLRKKLEKNALETFQNHFTTSKIGLEFIDIMKRHGLLH